MQNAQAAAQVQPLNGLNGYPPVQSTQAHPHPHQMPARTPAAWMPAGPRPYPTGNRPPRPPTLPPTLTDEQLAVMDSLTREAIDERLRVLEGVSGAIFRCIDDLIRVRSALPASSPAATATPPVTPANHGGSSSHGHADSHPINNPVAEPNGEPQADNIAQAIPQKRPRGDSTDSDRN
jgi:hypothetical protein